MESNRKDMIRDVLKLMKNRKIKNDEDNKGGT